ncbi:MAG: GxxExxY protein, partial [bacterium]
MEKGFKYKEITYQILNADFEIHNIPGCGFLEKVYENSVVCELRLKRMKVEAQKRIEIFYKGKEVGIYVADLIVEDKVIVEVKAVDEISKI